MATTNIKPQTPRQVQLFHERCLGFKKVYGEGLALLTTVGGVNQILRLHKDNIAKLPNDGIDGVNYQVKLNAAREIVQISTETKSKVDSYKTSLSEELALLDTAIAGCKKITPEEVDLTVDQDALSPYNNETHTSLIKGQLKEKSSCLLTHEYCAQVLPVLCSYKAQGVILQSRFVIVMNSTVKGFDIAAAEGLGVAEPFIAADEAARTPKADTATSWAFLSYLDPRNLLSLRASNLATAVTTASQLAVGVAHVSLEGDAKLSTDDITTIKGVVSSSVPDIEALLERVNSNSKEVTIKDIHRISHIIAENILPNWVTSTTVAGIIAKLPSASAEEEAKKFREYAQAVLADSSLTTDESAQSASIDKFSLHDSLEVFVKYTPEEYSGKTTNPQALSLLKNLAGIARIMSTLTA